MDFPWHPCCLRVICLAIVLAALSGGIDKNTPVAVIQDGTTARHKMISGTVSNIASKVKREKIKSPAIIIIGNVVDLADSIGWR